MNARFTPRYRRRANATWETQEPVYYDTLEEAKNAPLPPWCDQHLVLRDDDGRLRLVWKSYA